MHLSILQNIGPKKSRPVTPADITTTVLPLLKPMVGLCMLPLGRHVDGALAIAHCQLDQEDPLRFFVHVDGYAVLNPIILARAGDPIRHQEGCMSFADRGTCGAVRHKNIAARFTILRADGSQEEHQETWLNGILAMIFQHEIDHMDGKHIFPLLK